MTQGNDRRQVRDEPGEADSDRVGGTPTSTDGVGLTTSDEPDTFEPEEPSVRES